MPTNEIPNYDELFTARGQSVRRAREEKSEHVAEILQKGFDNIAEAVKELARQADIYGQMDATLHVNFGPNGRTKQGLVKADEHGMRALMSVLEHYVYKVTSLENRLSELEQQTEPLQIDPEDFM